MSGISDNNVENVDNVNCATSSTQNSRSSNFKDKEEAMVNEPNNIETMVNEPNNVDVYPNGQIVSLESRMTPNQSDGLFRSLSDIRKCNMNNVIISHLNVNSLSSKFCEIKELLNVCRFEVLVLSETKLDASFKQATLDIEGYSCVRQDKRSNSGGLLTYISNDIPFSVGRINLCNDDIECTSVELNIADQKLLLLGMYKNPRMEPLSFKVFFEETCEQMSEMYENIIIIGDLNFNMLQDNVLSTIMPPFNLTNVINQVTCFKSSQPTLIDVMLVNKRRKILKSFSENTGISDFHNLIGGILRAHKPVPRTKKITIRKVAQINYDAVLSEISEDYVIGEISSQLNMNEAYDRFHDMLCKILDKHAPKKKIIIKKNDFHCMTKELRKAILHRNQLRNKYYKYRSNHYLSLYRVQRNKVTEIKRKEISSYFTEKCKEGTRNKDFWKAIKPLFSKSRTKSDSIPLCENGELITDDLNVCNIFNDFFRNIGSDIGFPEYNSKPLENIVFHYKDHGSVKLIRETIRQKTSRMFTFRFVTEVEVRRVIKSLSAKKAAGYDEIPALFIKKVGMKLIKPICQLFNQCIMENTFPDKMKMANITPLFKKKDKLNKDNYRSVNLLPVLSKIFEKLLYKQMFEFMENLFHRYLSGFRKGHSCQDILVRMIEDWRKSLDQGSVVGVIAIDLSKAFDCMPHGLLLAKLSAYGFDNNACKLMKSYLMKRQQRVKIGETFSNWVNNIKGVPQGSILGPLLFNIFVNDFLYFKFQSKIYNYADDNTLCCTDANVQNLKERLHADCSMAMQWFTDNSMKANANKFQVMFLSRTAQLTDDIITVGDISLKASNSINILGVEIDECLKFNTHIDDICSQAGKQINALKRIRHYLDKRCRTTIYNSYINSSFNYCSVAWMFTNKGNREKLEKTNKRALSFITGKSHLDYDQICKENKQLNVHRKCVKATAILMYKVKRGIAPSFVSEMFNSQISNYEMRDNNKFVLPQFNTMLFGRNSFRYYGAKLWNNIPIAIKNSPSLNTFKSAMSKWLLSCDEKDIN